MMRRWIAGQAAQGLIISPAGSLVGLGTLPIRADTVVVAHHANPVARMHDAANVVPDDGVVVVDRLG